MNLYDVLERPVLSEKSNSIREQQGKYTFFVNRKATKVDVKKAVEEAFNVNVVKVTTNVTRGKHRRRGMRISLSRPRKKAVVTLSQGQKLSLFEDQ